jgi:SAM-dependent methyltransferase
MKLTIAPEHPLERLVLALGVVPVTLMDTHMSFIRARAIMVGTRLGVFDAIDAGARTAEAIAAACHTDPAATQKLANALVGSGYLHFRDGRYGLSPVARTWICSSSPRSLRDKILFEFAEWAMIEKMEEYVRDGEPLDMHAAVDASQWALYQRAMRALSGIAAPEVVRRIPVPRGAKAMLDIGGSHGFYAVSLCRRHAGLTAVILDLPEAIAHAAPILAREGMGDRVTHRPGNALTEELGTEAWDLIFVSQLVHHFDEAANRALAARIARALRPGGVFVILELIRPPDPDSAGQVGALLDLYFALTSQSGTWSPEEMTGWQRGVGLVPRKTIYLRTMPGAAAIVAVKASGRQAG